MTMSGTWMAKSSTKSHSPRSAISSMIWFDSSRMWSESWRTMRGVKPLLTSRRWRVCSGSSIEMIDIGAATFGRTPWAAEYSVLVAADVADVLVAGHDPQLVAGVPPQRRVVCAATR